MRITHLGHACLVIETADTRILVDPGVWSPRAFEQRDLDAVLVTHQHPDHLDGERLPDLLRANGDPLLVTDPDTAKILRATGVEATALTGGEQVRVNSVTVSGAGAQHAVINAALDRITNTGMVVRADGEPTVFHAGDALDADPGQIDVLAFALNAPWQASKEMAAFLARLAPAHAVPVHDGLLNPTGRELYLSQARQFGSPTSELHDLADGEPWSLGLSG